MADQKTAALPLNAYGYFDQMAGGLYDLNYNIASRQLDYRRLLRDTGFRMRDGKIAVDRRDSADPYNALALARRESVTDAVDRGFGPRGAMFRANFIPQRRMLRQQAKYAFADKTFENTSDRIDYRRMLSQAQKAAARFGVDNGLWMPPKVGGKR